MRGLKNFNLLIVCIFVFSLILAGCGTDKSKNTETNSAQTTLEPIKVEIQLPENIEPGQEVSIKTKVTQGNKAVEDADEVQFEIWEQNNDNHEKISAKHEGNGVYGITKTFPNDGVYQIISHVTARGLHTMPKQEFTVGNPSVEEEHADEHEHAEGEEHHEHTLAIQLKTDELIKANQDVKLAAQIKQEDQPLTGAEVQFEIWKENTSENDKQWAIATETTDGNYESQAKFNGAGSYLVTVHVKKGDIHDHLEQVVKVQ